MVPALVLLVVLAAAYLKIAVVIAVLRQGLSGAASILPASVGALLALALSVLVMAPVARDCHQRLSAAPDDPIAALAPLQGYLDQHTQGPERALVQRLLRERATPEKDSLRVLAPAYALGELRLAFQLALLLLLPFVLIDILVAALIRFLALEGLSVPAVALPLKLLVFVLVGGWSRLAEGLLSGS